MIEERTNRKRQPWRNWLRVGMTVALVAAAAACAAFYYAFCNVPRHSPEWTAQRREQAIDRGLEFLFKSKAFEKRYEAGEGEHIVHHFLLQLVLAKARHLRLKVQMDQANELNQDLPKWRNFSNLPGWPAKDLSAADRQEIQSMITGDSEPYVRWILWAVHASWAELDAPDQRVLFEDTSLLKDSYDLTHAVIVYWMLQQTAPLDAERLQVTARINELAPRIQRYAAWAPRCSDGYHERVAFLLLTAPAAKISRRWIERILTVQNDDGGWMWIPRYSRTVEEFLGLKITSHPSQPHPTFLALLALTYYDEQLRAGGDAPATRGR